MSYFATNADLFNGATPVETVIPWKPRALSHEEWTKRDYRAVYAWRMDTLAKLRADPLLLADAKHYYSTRPAEFIMHWMDTYDPRKSPTHAKPELRGPKRMPFVLFSKQAHVVDFLHEMRQTGENGLIEKCRDVGITWLACGYSVWSWLFIDGDAIGWGSRKQELVDKIGDPSSIFEKLRMLIRGLPDVFKPAGLKERDHLKSMNLVNPDNGATIIGEIGHSIGRGGRTSMYFKDESAHYEQPESIQAALDDNTHVQIDISSVNGLGNVFHRRREAGIDWTPGVKIEPGYVRVCIVDWRDHPEKTQEWYDRRKAKAEREGMQHIFAQEVDRNYSAAIQNTIIPYEWLQACIDAHLKVPYLRIPPPDVWYGGLDVADEGLDRNALALRQWIILRSVDEWGERDQGVTTRKTVGTVRERNLKRVIVEYDSIGVGAGVKTEYNRLVDEGVIDRNRLRFVPWAGSMKVLDPFGYSVPDDPESLTNAEFYENLKAQAWWSVRTRAYKTWRAVVHGDVYEPDELISFDGQMPNLLSILKELAQPTKKEETTGSKLVVDKKPKGTKSPNMGDAVIMAFFPVPEQGGEIFVGGMSG